MKALLVLSALVAVHCVTALPCVTYYTASANTQVTTGTPLLTATTVTACQAACDAQAACVAFDFNAAASTCSIITNTDAAAPATGVTHYTRAKACDYTSTTERCFYTYRGENSYTAASLKGPTRGQDTVDKCLDFCVSSGAGCTASFFNATGSECFFLSDPYVAGNLVGDTDFRAYEPSSCNAVPLTGTCEDAYIITPNYAKENGHFASANDTQVSCELSCNASSACLGFDFVGGQNRCFLHMDATQPEGVKAGVTHYRKVKSCKTNDTCSYKSFGDYVPAASFIRTPQGGIISLTECIVACGLLGDACKGASFNIDFKSDCNLYLTSNSPTAFADLTIFRQVAGEVSYSRETCSTTTTIAPTAAPGVCAVQYRPYPGMKLQGAIQLGGSQALATCQAGCTAATNPCWGLDYNTAGSTCWLFYYSTTAVSPYTTPGQSPISTESHYEKFWKCGECEYDIYVGSRSTSLEATPTTVTVDACLIACNAATTCHGADYISNQCYFLTGDPIPTTRIVDATSTQYVKKNCVGTPGTIGCNYNNFVLYAAKKISGGVLTATTAATNASCQAKCSESNGCYAYDTNSASECYLLTTYGELRDVQTAGENHFHRQPKCDFATLKDCNFFHTGTFKPIITSSIIGSETITRDACLEGCTTRTGCSGLTYESVGQTCTWFGSGSAGKWNLTDLVNSNVATLEGYIFNGCTGTGTTIGPGTTLDPGTTVGPTGACVGGTWADQINMHGPSGIQQTNIQGLAACQQTCIDNINCVAIDVNTNGCWIFQTNLPTPEPLTGTTHYILTRCSDITTPTPTGVCEVEYVKRGTMKLAGGDPVNGVNTLDGCVQSCEANPLCTQVDYQTAVNACYNHTATTQPTSSGSEPVDNYRKNWECSGCNYINYPNRRAAGGVPKSAYTNLKDCINACSADSTCISITFNSSPVTCEFHSTSVISALAVATGYHHWFNTGTKPCAGAATGDTTQAGGTTQPTPAACVNTYAKTADRHIIGGIKNTEATTEATCKAACDANDACKSLDFNAGNECYILNTTSPLVVETGTDNFRKITTCGACTVSTQYDVRAASKIVGGEQNTTAGTQALCQSVCDAQSDCAGFDFNGANECWITKAGNRNNIVGQSPNEVVTHFTKYAACGSCKYELRPASAVSGSTGSVQSGVATWKDCVATCSSQGAACQSVDFNNTSSECKHFSSSFETTGRINVANVNHYFKKNCSEDGGTTDSGGTTDAATTATPAMVCPASYKSYPGEKIRNLNPSNGVPNQAQCQNVCDASSTCVGYDYNSQAGAAQPCWTQTDGSLARAPQGNMETVTHYELRRSCPGCTFNADGGAGGVGAGPATYNVHAATTEEACIGACGQLTTCLAAALVLGQCRHATSAATRTENNVRLWRKVAGSCTGTAATTAPPEASCTETYISYPNQHVSGGTQNTDTTDAACAASCTSNANCVGYDFVNNVSPPTPQCYLITTTTAQRTDITPETGVTHYSKVMNCGGTCYRQIQNSASSTFANFAEPSRVNCLLQCNAGNNCRDVVYNDNPTIAGRDKCRYVQASAAVVSHSSLETEAGATFYSRLSSCATGATRAG